MLLEGTIYPEEITHVAAGLKWFTWLWVRDCPDLHKDKKEKCLQELSQWNPCLKEEEEDASPCKHTKTNESHVPWGKQADLAVECWGENKLPDTARAGFLQFLNGSRVEAFNILQFHIPGS